MSREQRRKIDNQMSVEQLEALEQQLVEQNVAAENAAAARGMRYSPLAFIQVQLDTLATLALGKRSAALWKVHAQEAWAELVSEETVTARLQEAEERARKSALTDGVAGVAAKLDPAVAGRVDGAGGGVVLPGHFGNGVTPPGS